MTRAFAFGDLAVLVESIEDGHLAWLAEFLGPHFEARAAARTCRVRLVEDRREYEAALAAGPGEGARDAFVYDTRMLSLPRWRGAAARLFDAKWQLFYDVAGPPLTVTILSAPGNWRVRSALVYVVRELATNHAQRAGGLLLHAAAFAVGSHGVLVGGPKRAGKTTLLVHALRAGSVEYVSNDRILVPPESARARGIPTAVGLRRDMLDRFPALAERLAAAGYDQRLTLDEAAARGAPAAARRVGPRLSPIQLCRLLGAPTRAECDITMLVFPRITGEPGGVAVRRLDGAETFARLEGALFGVDQGRWTSDVFTLPDDPPPPDRAALAAGCHALATRVAGFECRLGLDAYEGSRASGDLLAALLAAWGADHRQARAAGAPRSEG